MDEHDMMVASEGLHAILRLINERDHIDFENFTAYREVRVDSTEIAEFVRARMTDAEFREIVPGVEPTRGVMIIDQEDGSALVRAVIKLDGPLVDALRTLREAGR